MPDLDVEFARWVSDEPFPGLVEVVLVDASGRSWSIVDKPPIFDESGTLGSRGDIPRLAVRCTVVGEGDQEGTVLVSLDWGVESTTGVNLFTVLAASLRD